MIVRTVLSGDTVVLTSARPGAQVQLWGDLTVRLIGLDAPDLAPVVECFAAEAQGGLGAMLPEGSLAWVTTNEQGDSGGIRSISYDARDSRRGRDSTTGRGTRLPTPRAPRRRAERPIAGADCRRSTTASVHARVPAGPSPSLTAS